MSLIVKKWDKKLQRIKEKVLKYNDCKYYCIIENDKINAVRILQ